ncbi:MAG: PTS fructose transporter subunit IIA [Burkholderiales bacterium]|jgi:PTS system ascorbate-specific IIA component|nr:PTS fructose transporter subunit IIA [Burkholderiales bacterium]
MTNPTANSSPVPIGVLLLMHAPLAESFLDVVSHVLGKRPPRCVALSVDPNEEVDEVFLRASRAVADLHVGSGVLIFTDICGATPYQVATRLLVPNYVALICGASVPMLVRSITHREDGFDPMIAKALSGAKDGIFFTDGHVIKKGDDRYGTA